MMQANVSILMPRTKMVHVAVDNEVHLQFTVMASSGSPHRFVEVHANADILQDLLLNSVGTLELKDSVLREDMLDNHNVVFSLLLSELNRGAALEQLSILGKLWHLQHSSWHSLSFDSGLIRPV